MRIVALVKKFTKFFNLILNKEKYFDSNTNVDIFYKNMVESGPLYIKFCQLLAQKTDMLNDNPYLKKKLSELHDNAPYHNMQTTEKIFKQNINKNIFDYFEIFDTEPIYSGSIGQIYLCKVHGINEQCIMKIKHEHIEKDLTNNILEFKDIAYLLKQASFKILNLIDLDAFYSQLLTQTDFNKEAQSTIAFKEHFKNNDGVIIPTIISNTNDFIIETYENGLNYDLFIKKHPDRKLECKIKSAKYFLDMVFVFRKFHMDCHNGNILYKLNNSGELEVIFVDFGTVCDITQEDRDTIGNLLKSLSANSEKLLIMSLQRCFVNDIQSTKYVEIIKLLDLEHFFRATKNTESIKLMKDTLFKLESFGIKIRATILEMIFNLSMILESVDMDYDFDIPVFDFVIDHIFKSEECQLQKIMKKIIHKENYAPKQEIINEFYRNYYSTGNKHEQNVLHTEKLEQLF
jgi:predicted unusual protein kinase regulating ubiquinone biosynthesis (AarF/ABC1/UbiB family)